MAEAQPPAAQGTDGATVDVAVPAVTQGGHVSVQNVAGTESQANPQDLPSPPPPEVYRPLSLLALAGLIIAVLYCGGVLFCGIVSLFRTPILLPTWTLIFPLGAAGLALAGWFEVQASEGTKAGKALALWGISLSIVFGLGYWAFYAASYYTIRQQAEQFSLQWFEKLQDGDLEGAFCLTIAPERRPGGVGPELRQNIEMKFNSGRMSGRAEGGEFDMFKQMELVRLVRQAGRDIEIKPRGVSSWEYADTGYKVKQTYRIVTSHVTLDAVVTAQSSQGRSKQFENARWYIVPQESALQMGSGTPTPLGETMMGLQGQSNMMVMHWVDDLRHGRLEEAYLATQDPARRTDLAKTYKKCIELDALLAVGLADSDVLTTLCTAACVPRFLEKKLPGSPQKKLPSYGEFTRGQLVRIDEANFWASNDENRDNALVGARKLFQRQGALPAGVMHVGRVKMLYWKRIGERIQIENEVRLHLRDLTGTVSAVVIVECDAEALQKKPPYDIRITAVELRTVRESGPVSPMEGGPGMRPGGRGGPAGMDEPALDPGMFK
jgi:hypothetical protein